jgi:hypothetical protein
LQDFVGSPRPTFDQGEPVDDPAYRIDGGAAERRARIAGDGQVRHESPADDSDTLPRQCIAQAVEWIAEGKQRNWKYM